VLGVAGPAGAGKSTVCHMLSHRAGVVHVCCDEMAWATYRRGGPSYAPLIARFGESILTEDGAVDREHLGRIILTDPQAKEDLEAIVHPAVMRELRAVLAHHRREGTRVALVEGALLLTSPHVDKTEFDAFVWLYAPEEVRLKRLLSSGLEGSKVRRRLSAQRDLEPPRDAAVYPVDSSGPPAQVADRIWNLIQSLSRSAPQRAQDI